MSCACLALVNGVEEVLENHLVGPLEYAGHYKVLESRFDTSPNFALVDAEPLPAIIERDRRRRRYNMRK